MPTRKKGAVPPSREMGPSRTRRAIKGRNMARKNYSRGPYRSGSRRYRDRKKGFEGSGASQAGPVTITKADGTVTVQPAYNMHENARVLSGALPGRTPLSSKLVWSVFNRDGGRCRYCRRRCGRTTSDEGTRWEIDHVVPVAAGGRDLPENLVLACRRCNQRKGVQLWQPIPLDEM